VSFTPETARASAILTEGRLVRFDLDVWAPSGTAMTAERSSQFAAARAQLHARSRQNDSVDLVLQIENPRTGAAVAQVPLPQIDCRATVDHANTFSAVEAGNEDPAVALQKWRDSMGAINVSSLALNW